MYCIKTIQYPNSLIYCVQFEARVNAISREAAGLPYKSDGCDRGTF